VVACTTGGDVSGVDGPYALRHPLAVKFAVRAICISVGVCLASCQDGDLTADPAPGTSDAATTSSTSTSPPSETTEDLPTTSTAPDTSSTGPDDSSSEPPDPTTGADECPDRPDGSYNDCVNGESCEGPTATCISDNPDDPAFGICSLTCLDDCDCFPDPNNIGAKSVCAPILEGGESACVLDCAGGQSCPSGAYCHPDFAICVYDLGGDPPDPDQLPDLQVGYWYLDDYALYPDAPTVSHLEILNEGPVDTEFQLVLLTVLSTNEVIGDADDILLFEGLYEYTVEAGDHALLYADLVMPPDITDGEYFVGILVDSMDFQPESDETNNFKFASEKVTITGNPMPTDIDLRPSDPAAPSPVFQGAETDFTFTVENLGPDAVAAYSVGLYYSVDATITTADTLICTHVDADGIAGADQEPQLASCAVPTIAGDRYFGVIVDPSDMLTEQDEANNVAAAADPVTIEVPDRDLEMGSVSSADNTPDTGQLVMLSATVTNTGTDPSPAFDVSFYLSTDANITMSDEFVCTADSGAPLMGGQQDVVSAQCVIPLVATGSYWLGAIADPIGAIVETDETNNDGASAGPLQVTAPDVDLEYELHFITGGIGNPSPGDTLTYHVQIRNNGTAASPASFEVNIHYSLDDSISLADPKACTALVGQVPALTITEFAFDCTVPDVAPGFYFSGVIIDPTNQVPETDETNNRGSSVFSELIQ
jgi:hypothetical protein